MKIISPSYKILTPISENGEDELKRIEQAARVCYKSENRITETSAKSMVGNLIKSGHEAALEHSQLSVLFTVDRAISHEIVRHRMSSFCLTGDMEIRSMNQKKWTIEELYNMQFDKKRKGNLKLMHLRSVDEKTGVIVKNRISKITKMGIKPVFQITTESGRFLKCTSDHEIYTPNGYRKLSDISVGDYIFANGKELLENPDWLRNFYLIENHTRKQTAEFIGCCESLVYRAFKKFGIKKPWSDRPNRHPGHGVKGMFSKESLKKLSESKSGENNPLYKKDRSELTISGGYSEANHKFEKNFCNICGTTNQLEIHHINKNPRDNSPENIMILCSKCHHLWHKKGAIGIFKDKVVSIKEIGEDTVYDISMEAPYFNFVANSIVVHNCQESTRYCNYSNDKFGNEITVIDIRGGLDLDKKTSGLERDDTMQIYWDWESAMKIAEQYYFELLEAGVSPQIARSVLPNSLKTELVMTANYREWRHFLKLRTAKDAHPQMREVTIPLLKELKEKIPVVFDDIEV